MARNEKKKRKKPILPIILGLGGVGLLLFFFTRKERVPAGVPGGDAEGAQRFAPGGGAPGTAWQDVSLPERQAQQRVEQQRLEQQRLEQQRQLEQQKVQAQLLQREREAEKRILEAAAKMEAARKAEEQAKQVAAEAVAKEEKLQDIILTPPAPSSTQPVTSVPTPTPTVTLGPAPAKTYTPPKPPTVTQPKPAIAQTRTITDPAAGDYDYATIYPPRPGLKYAPNALEAVLVNPSLGRKVVLRVPHAGWQVVQKPGWQFAKQWTVVAVGVAGNTVPRTRNRFESNVAKMASLGEPLKNGQTEALSRILGLP